jgi:hypothetical protein
MFDATGQLDARRLIAGLPLGGRTLDPGDSHALRCPWGGVVTADGREIEIATPPLDLADGGIAGTVALAARGHGALVDGLDAALDDGVRMRGYSTHLNVEVDDRDAVRIARTVVARMAVPVMLLLDRRDSPGLLVRPRHRRLELGGEYQTGDALRASLVMAVGVTMAAERLLRDRRSRRRAPPVLDLRTVPSPQRYGWYVDRRAGGPDLYTEGRAAALRTARGRSISAGEVLDATWLMARGELIGVVDDIDLTAVDALVDGRVALPCESEAADQDVVRPPVCAIAVDAPERVDVLADRDRRGIQIRTVAATWHAVCLRAERAGATRWIDVPGEQEEPFFRALDAGELDDWLDDVLATT